MMKDSFAPLILALSMVFSACFFLHLNHSQHSETIKLASEIEDFLNDHQMKSIEDLTAQQKAQKLLNLVQRPNRATMIMLSLVFAMQAFSMFFKNTKGRYIIEKAQKIWTWRP